jgi:hypothetical protein
MYVSSWPFASCLYCGAMAAFANSGHCRRIAMPLTNDRLWDVANIDDIDAMQRKQPSARL